MNKVTDDDEFSNFFLQDLKNLGTSAENVLKKVQDMIDDKSVQHHYIKSNEQNTKISKFPDVLFKSLRLFTASSRMIM